MTDGFTFEEYTAEQLAARWIVEWMTAPWDWREWQFRALLGPTLIGVHVGALVIAYEWWHDKEEGT